MGGFPGSQNTLQGSTLLLKKRKVEEEGNLQSREVMWGATKNRKGQFCSPLPGAGHISPKVPRPIHHWFLPSFLLSTVLVLVQSLESKEELVHLLFLFFSFLKPKRVIKRTGTNSSH